MYLKSKGGFIQSVSDSDSVSLPLRPMEGRRSRFTCPSLNLTGNADAVAVAVALSEAALIFTVIQLGNTVNSSGVFRM